MSRRRESVRIRLVLQLCLHHVRVDERLGEGGDLVLHAAPLDVLVRVVAAAAEPLVILVIVHLSRSSRDERWVVVLSQIDLLHFHFTYGNFY